MKYRSGTSKPINDGDAFDKGLRVVESPQDAAFAFADREARRKFGKRGYCHHIRLDTYTRNGRCFNYEAFVGTRQADGMTSGHNIWLTVTVEE